MKTLLKAAQMIDHAPEWFKDAILSVSKTTGVKTEDVDLYRRGYSEKAKVNELDPKSRKALKYVSTRTIDRDGEIVIPSSLDLSEFVKYGHVLVNHNYGLLPIGSDESIEADDYGIKALTRYADTGEGTLANIVWSLVSQGHMKASSVGFVVTDSTKKGDKNWDSVCNKLEHEWKEFSKDIANTKIKRIITGGILIEHSDVSVPCNVDANTIQVVKAFDKGDVLLKQLGWSNTAASTEKSLGNLSYSDLFESLRKLLPQGEMVYITDLFEDHFVYYDGKNYFKQSYAVTNGEASLVGEPAKVMRRTVYQLESDKGADIPGEYELDGLLHKGSAVGCLADGNPVETQKPYPGEHAARLTDPDKYVRFARQNDKFGEGIHAIFGVLEDGGKTELQAIRFDKDKFTVEEAEAWLEEHEYTTIKFEPASEKKPKSVPSPSPERDVKVLRDSPSVNVLFVPPSQELIAKSVAEAVDRALATRMGKVLR